MQAQLPGASEAQRQAEVMEGIVQRRTSGLIRDLRVELHDGLIVLSGRSSTYYAKQLAETAAMELAGHHELANEIVVC